MNIKIYPSKVSGSITAPPSKSVTHRSLIVAALSVETSKLTNVLLSEDTIATINALKAFGVAIEVKGNTVTIQGSKGKLKAPKQPIYLGNSGSSMRMLAGIASLADGITTLTGERRLCERPIGDLLDSLKSLGITASSLNRNNCPPISIQGGSTVENTVYVKGNTSSQYLTALLLVAPFAKETLTVIVNGELRSKPYVALTIDVMKTFGVSVKNQDFKKFTIKNGQRYHGTNYTVEGDYSSASYFFATAAITRGSVAVNGLNINSAQGDKYFVDILSRMGCEVSLRDNTVIIQNKKRLAAITCDMSDYPDTVQTLAVTAAFASGTTHLTNIDHLRYKESDRIATTIAELNKIGIQTSYNNSSLAIYGGNPQGAIIDTHNDHRVALSFAVAATAAKVDTVIRNAEVVNKSYPGFFEDFQRIGAKLEVLP